jgi:uncharacterized protein YllA (UPF0747 family)
VSGDLLPWDLLARERKLFLDHLAGGGEARALLGGRGWDDDAVAAAAEERRRAGLPHRADLARAAAEYARTLGVPDAEIAAKRLADPRAVAIVGAHQPTVAGGPLLSFAKAIGAIALARRLEAAGAGPAVPVWWVASEDHDLAEAGAVRVGDGKRGSALLKGDPAERRMLARVAAPALSEAAGDAGGSEFACAVVRGGGAPEGASLGLAAARIFADLFARHGLVVLEPHVVRPFAGAVLARDVREPGVLAAAVRAGNAAVRAAGYATVLDDPEGPLHFRVDGEGRRTRGGGTEEDLRDPARRLSADVALRVLVQDAALPVAAQVGGPSEIEYLAAVRPARGAAGVFAPCAVPRPGVTILEKRVEEALRAFGTDVAALYRDGEAALRAPEAAEDPLIAESRRMRAQLEKAAGDAERLPAAVRSRLGRARDGLEELAAAVERAEAERRGVGEGRRRRVLEALLPDGEPQERRWTLLPFLLRHGPALAERMVDALSGAEPGHRVMRT